MSEIDEKLMQRYREKKAQEEGANPLKEINVSVKTEGIEKLVKYNTSLEEQLEQERTLREDYENKLKLIGEQKLKEHADRLRKLGYKGNLDSVEAVKSAEEHMGLIKEGGKGSVGLTTEQIARERGSSGEQGYGSHEEMVKVLKQQAKEGNKEAQEQLNELWEKTVKGWKEQPQQTLGHQTEFPNALEDFKKSQNRAWKRKHGYVEKEGE